MSFKDFHRSRASYSVWLANPERRWLGMLFANERDVGPVLKFLEGTDVGSREGASEGEGARMAEEGRPRRRKPTF